MIVDEHIESRFRDSVSPTKWDVVGRDVHLREVIDQISRRQYRLDELDRYAVLTVKACGVLARKSSAIVKWLHANGFDIVDAWTTMITPECSRILWRWQLEKATRQRLWVMDSILASSDTVVLILRRDRDNTVPATTWLSQHKGPANQDKQRPGQLRHALKPTCYLLNYVHTCDDAVDLFRDVYVLGGMEKVTALCETIDNGVGAPPRGGIWQIISAAERDAAFHDMALRSSVTAIERQFLHAGPVNDLSLIDQVITNEFVGPTTESSILTRCSPIDIAVYMAHRFDMSVPGARDPFESVSGTQ